jgi:FAD/FMN-containing dehydrogenase
VSVIDRRAFLRRAGVVSLAAGLASQVGWLTAYGSDEVGSGALRELARRVRGRVVIPGDRGYRAAHVLFNSRFDDVRPQAVVFCDDVHDVETTIRWAEQHDVPFVPRGGRHSYAGYSTTRGVVIDVTRLNAIEVDGASGTARIGAGARLIDVYSQLAQHGVSIPAGSCPSVGISGLTLGGGLGLSSRKYGLTIDNLTALELVTAEGRALPCDQRDHPDLFWASRGGGGGNFGVATSFTFRVFPVDQVSTFMLEWPWEHAQALTDVWQQTAPYTPDELFSILKLASDGGKPGQPKPPPVVRSFGQYFGPEEELVGLLEPLLNVAAPTKRQIATSSYMDAQLLWADCTGSIEQCHLTVETPQGTVERIGFKNKSDYVTAPLPAAAVDTAIDWIERWPGSAQPDGGAMQMDTHGGAINRVAPDATAFVHRDTLYSIQYLSHWNPKEPRRVADANLRWIRGFYRAMRPYVSGFAYQNYIDPDIRDWQHAYYGSNLARLVEVKRTYDPHGRFRFGQSIPQKLS